MTFSISAMRQKNGTANARQIPRNAVLIVVAGIGDPGWEHDDPASWPGSMPPATDVILTKVALFIGESAREQSRAEYEGRARRGNRLCRIRDRLQADHKFSRQW